MTVIFLRRNTPYGQLLIGLVSNLFICVLLYFYWRVFIVWMYSMYTVLPFGVINVILIVTVESVACLGLVFFGLPCIHSIYTCNQWVGATSEDKTGSIIVAECDEIQRQGILRAWSQSESVTYSSGTDCSAATSADAITLRRWRQKSFATPATCHHVNINYGRHEILPSRRSAAAAAAGDGAIRHMTETSSVYNCYRRHLGGILL